MVVKIDDEVNCIVNKGYEFVIDIFKEYSDIFE